MYKPHAILLADSYKFSHHKMLPPGARRIYANFTPRSIVHSPEFMEEVVVFHYLEEEYDLQNNGINAYMKPLCDAIFHTPGFLILSRIVVFILNGGRLLWGTIMLCGFLWGVVHRYRYYIKRRNIMTTSFPR